MKHTLLKYHTAKITNMVRTKLVFPPESLMIKEKKKILKKL